MDIIYSSASHIHGLLVSFPVVLLSLALITLIIEQVALKFSDYQIPKVERINLPLSLMFHLLGCVSVWPAFLSGYLANEGANGFFLIADDVISIHQMPAKFLLFLSIPSLIFVVLGQFATFHRMKFRVVAHLTLIIMCGLILLTAWRGASLVFKHGAGVKSGAIAEQHQLKRQN